MAVYHGLCNHCFWSYHTGQLSQDDWDRYLTAMGEATNEHGATAILTLTFEAVPPTAQQRRELANLAASSRPISRHALVTSSPLVRGVLTAMDWLLMKSYDEKAFAEPLAAMEWVGEAAGCRASDLQAAVRAQVPLQELEPRLVEPGADQTPS